MPNFKCDVSLQKSIDANHRDLRLEFISLAQDPSAPERKIEEILGNISQAIEGCLNPLIQKNIEIEQRNKQRQEKHRIALQAYNQRKKDAVQAKALFQEPQPIQEQEESKFYLHNVVFVGFDVLDFDTQVKVSASVLEHMVDIVKKQSWHISCDNFKGWGERQAQLARQCLLNLYVPKGALHKPRPFDSVITEWLSKYVGVNEGRRVLSYTNNGSSLDRIYQGLMGLDFFDNLLDYIKVSALGSFSFEEVNFKYLANFEAPEYIARLIAAKSFPFRLVLPGREYGDELYALLEGASAKGISQITLAYASYQKPLAIDRQHSQFLLELIQRDTEAGRSACLLVGFTSDLKKEIEEAYRENYRVVHRAKILALLSQKPKPKAKPEERELVEHKEEEEKKDIEIPLDVLPIAKKDALRPRDAGLPFQALVIAGSRGLLKDWLRRIKRQRAQVHVEQQQQQQQQQQQEQQQEQNQEHVQSAYVELQILEDKDIIDYPVWERTYPSYTALYQEKQKIWFEWTLKGLKLEHNLDGFTRTAKDKIVEYAHLFHDGFDFDFLPEGFAVGHVKRGNKLLRILYFDYALVTPDKPLRTKLTRLASMSPNVPGDVFKDLLSQQDASLLTSLMNSAHCLAQNISRLQKVNDNHGSCVCYGCQTVALPLAEEKEEEPASLDKKIEKLFNCQKFYLRHQLEKEIKDYIQNLKKQVDGKDAVVAIPMLRLNQSRDYEFKNPALFFCRDKRDQVNQYLALFINKLIEQKSQPHRPDSPDSFMYGGAGSGRLLKDMRERLDNLIVLDGYDAELAWKHKEAFEKLVENIWKVMGEAVQVYEKNLVDQRAAFYRLLGGNGDARNQEKLNKRFPVLEQFSLRHLRLLLEIAYKFDLDPKKKGKKAEVLEAFLKKLSEIHVLDPDHSTFNLLFKYVMQPSDNWLTNFFTEDSQLIALNGICALTPEQRKNWNYLLARHGESCGFADIHHLWEAFDYFNSQYARLSGNSEALDFSQFPESCVKNAPLFLSFLLTILKTSRNRQEQIALLRSGQIPIDQWGAYYAMRYQGYYLVAPEMGLTVTLEQIEQAIKYTKKPVGESPPIDYRISRSQLIALFTQEPPAKRADLLRAYYRYIGQQPQAAVDFECYKRCAEQCPPGEELSLALLAITSTDKRTVDLKENIPELWRTLQEVAEADKKHKEQGRADYLPEDIQILLDLHKQDDFAALTFVEAVTLLRLWGTNRRCHSNVISATLRLWGYTQGPAVRWNAHRNFYEVEKIKLQSFIDPRPFLHVVRTIFSKENREVELAGYLEYVRKIKKALSGQYNDISERQWHEKLYEFVSRVPHPLDREMWEPWDKVIKALGRLHRYSTAEGHSVARRLVVMLTGLPSASMGPQELLGLLEILETYAGKSKEPISDRDLFAYLQKQKSCENLVYPGLLQRGNQLACIKQSISELLKEVKDKFHLEENQVEDLQLVLENTWNPEDLDEKELTEEVNQRIENKARKFLYQVLDEKAVWSPRRSDFVKFLTGHPCLGLYGLDFLSNILQEAANLPFIDSELIILKKLLSPKRSPLYIRKLVDSQKDFCAVIGEVCKSTRLSKIQREEIVSVLGRYTGTLYNPNLALEKLTDFLLHSAENYPPAVCDAFLVILKGEIKREGGDIAGLFQNLHALTTSLPQGLLSSLLHNLVSRHRNPLDCAQILQKAAESLYSSVHGENEEAKEGEKGPDPDPRTLHLLARTLGRKDSGDEVLQFLDLLQQLQAKSPGLYAILDHLCSHPPKLGIKKLLVNLTQSISPPLAEEDPRAQDLSPPLAGGDGLKGQRGGVILLDAAALSHNLKILEIDPHYGDPKVAPREVFNVQTVARKIAQIKDPGRHAHGQPRSLFISQQQKLLNWVVAVESLDTEIAGFGVFTEEDEEKGATEPSSFAPAEHLTHKNMAALMHDYRAQLSQPDISDTQKQQILLRSLAIMRRAMYKATKKTPDSSQIQDVCATTVAHLKGVRLGQVDTGQGKTIISAMNAACMWLLHGQALVLTSDPGLAARDLAENHDFFELLGISVANKPLTQNSTPQDVCEGGVNYGTFADLKLFRQAMQLRGDKAAQTLLLPEETGLVIDEVDDAKLDDATGYRSTVPQVASDNPDVSPLAYYYQAMEREFLDSAEALAVLQNQDATEANMLQCLHKFLMGLAIENVSQQEQLTALLRANPEQLRTWFASLLRAQDMQEGVDFAVVPEYKIIQGELRLVKKVCPYTTSGRSNPRVQYSDGLQQFLQARMYRETRDPAFLIPPESEVLLASNNDSVFYEGYAGIVGLTATLGSPQEVSRRLRRFPMHLCILPPHQDKQRVDLSTKYCSGVQEHREAIKKHILDILQSPASHPILLITQNAKQIRELKPWLEAVLRQLDPPVTLQILDGEQSPQEEREIIKNGGNKRVITFATALAGRGFDIRPQTQKKEEQEEKEEKQDPSLQLEVLGITPPPNYRKELQFRGRTGRRGAGGRSRFIIYEGDLVTKSGKQITTLTLEALYADNEAWDYQQWQLNSYLGYIHDVFGPLFLDIRPQILSLQDEEMCSFWDLAQINFLKALKQKEQDLREQYPDDVENFQQGLLAFACTNWKDRLQDYNTKLLDFEGKKKLEYEQDKSKSVKADEKEEKGEERDFEQVYSTLLVNIVSLKTLLAQQASFVSAENLSASLPCPQQPYLDLPLPSDAERPELVIPSLQQAYDKVLALPAQAVGKVEQEEEEEKQYTREQEEQEEQGEQEGPEQEGQGEDLRQKKAPEEPEAKAPEASQDFFLGALTVLVKACYLESQGVDLTDAERAIRGMLQRYYPSVILPEATILSMAAPQKYRRADAMPVQDQEDFCVLTCVTLQIDPATSCTVYVDYTNNCIYADIDPELWIELAPPPPAPKPSFPKPSTHYAYWFLFLFFCLAAGTAFTVTGTAASLGIPYLATWSLTSAFSLATLSTFNFWVLMGFGVAVGLTVFLIVLGCVKLGGWAFGPKPAGKSLEPLDLIRLDLPQQQPVGSRELGQNSLDFSPVLRAEQNAAGSKKTKTPRPPAEPKGQ